MRAGAVHDGESRDDDTLMLFGGLALVVLGAGLILSNRTVRRYVGELEPGTLVRSAVPDLERYLRLRAM
jgi:hypothetical protein